MKKGLLFLFLIGISFTAICQANSTAHTSLMSQYNLSQKFIEGWIADSTGCKKIRYQHQDSIYGNKKLIGIRLTDFINLFGKPNENSTNYFGVQILTYYVLNVCDNNNVILDSEISEELRFCFKDGILVNCLHSSA
jgi:hypothetical protein